MAIKCLILFVSLFTINVTIAWPEYPHNEYVYSLERDELLDAERAYQNKYPQLELNQVRRRFVTAKM